MLRRTVVEGCSEWQERREREEIQRKKDAQAAERSLGFLRLSLKRLQTDQNKLPALCTVAVQHC